MRIPQARDPREMMPSARSNSATLPDADLYLVACVKTKQSGPMEAWDLYCSAWFRRARDCVERTGRTWAVLSAKHGLVWPTNIIEYYNDTLLGKPSHERRRWAADVLDSLDPHLDRVRKVAMLAGKYYREFLVQEFKQRDIETLVPMERIKGIGPQIAWLNACLSCPQDNRYWPSRRPA